MQCRCNNIRHVNHLGKPCPDPASELDDYCKDCHDKAADEAMAAILPTNQPVQIQARLQDRFTLADSLSIDKVSEFYKRNVWAIVLAVIVTIGSTGIGLIFSGPFGAALGFIISLLAIFLLPPTYTKIREIERRP